MFPFRTLMWSLGITLFYSSFVFAQQVISLDEAVRLFKQNSLERKRAFHSAQLRKGEAAAFSAFPNPTVNVYREDLSRGLPTYNELTISIRQQVDVLGQPFLKWSAASAESEAAELQLQHQELVLVQQLKSRYADLLFFQQKLKTIEATAQTVQRAYNAAKARKEEGSLSGFELQRFSVELAKNQKELSSVVTDLQTKRRELLTEIYPNALWTEGDFVNLILSDSLQAQPLLVTISEAESLAFLHRTDLRAAALSVIAARSRLSAAQRDRSPALFLEGGFKQQSDGSKGYVFGASVSIPIFNLNSGNIQIAEALHLESEVSSAIARRKVLLEVRSAFRSAEALWSRWKDLQAAPQTSTLLEVAVFTYNEGKLSLIELLDAARAYSEGETLRIETLAEYNKSLFILDTAIGGYFFTRKGLDK